MIRTRIRVVRCTIVGAGGTFLGVPGRSPASWPKTPVQHFFCRSSTTLDLAVCLTTTNQQLIFLFLVDAVFPQASETPLIFSLRRNDNNIFCNILSNRVDDIVSGAISVKVNCESVSYTPLFKKSFSAISRNIITPQRCVAPGATSRALTEQIRTQQNTAEHSRTQQNIAEHSRT